MRVDLIKVSAPSPFKTYKKYMGSPPQNIFSVAATTPDYVELALVDETINMKANIETDAELVGLFMSTPDAIRAYELGDALRQKGKTVVFGGLHASFMPEEALQHGDAVLIGEAEEIWEELLQDYNNGSLQSRYERSSPLDLANLNPYPTDYISKNKYDGVWSVVVSRGCRHKCSFCLVNPFFKPKMRYRPISQVIDEIKKSGTKKFELHSDYLTADRDYALELFKALAPLNIDWVGESTINIAEDDELLFWAAESGLSYLLVGLETPSSSALINSGKGFVKVNEVKDYIDKLHQHNIIVDSAFIFGFDEHNGHIFKDSLDFARDINLDVGHSVIMIPFPGSQLYEQLEQEGRILTKDWSLYDGAHAVFQPKNLEPQTLEQGAEWFYKKINRRNYRFKKRTWLYWA